MLTEHSVAEAVHAAGLPARSAYVVSTGSTNADLTGCNYHPNTTKHRAMADEAITFIKSKTGW